MSWHVFSDITSVFPCHFLYLMSRDNCQNQCCGSSLAKRRFFIETLYDEFEDCHYLF